MREIKFRVWDFPCKIMRGWNWIRKCEYPFDHDYGGADLLTTEYFALMQYTGLKDKNGREIYEGDILDRDQPQYEGGNLIGVGTDICEIKWDDASWKCEFPDSEIILLSDYEPSTGTVVGNIYENPELIA